MRKRFSEESGKIAEQIAVIEKLTKQLFEQAAEVSEEVARIKEKYRIKWEQEVGAIIEANEVSPPQNRASVQIDGDYASREDFLKSFQGIPV